MRKQIGPYFCKLSTDLAPICPKAPRAERSALQGKAYAATNDDVRAFERYRLAAEQGHPLAQIQLGDCYKKGQGVPKDEAQAAAWYRKAAEQNHPLAQVELGDCYKKGQGVPKNTARAVAWYRRAAEQNDAEAQFKLGWCYEKGQGVPKDEALAAAWYRKAADKGSLAKVALERLEQKLRSAAAAEKIMRKTR